MSLFNCTRGVLRFYFVCLCVWRRSNLTLVPPEILHPFNTNKICHKVLTQHYFLI